jgi:hypothetical protein
MLDLLKVKVENPEGRQTLGSVRRRLKDIIKMN